MSRFEEINRLLYDMRGTLANDPDTLKRAIDLQKESLSMDNRMVTRNETQNDRYREAIWDRKTQWAFIIPEVETMGPKKIKEFMRRNKGLRRHKLWFDRIFANQKIREKNIPEKKRGWYTKLWARY